MARGFFKIHKGLNLPELEVDPQVTPPSLSRVGDMAIYNNELYVCVERPNSGGFVYPKWEKVHAGDITNSEVAVDAQISGTKITPDFGDQTISTTGQTVSGSLELNGNISLGSGASNNLSIGSSSDTITIPGNLHVDGTTTTIDSEVLEVADKKVTLNVGGTTTSASGAGIEIEGDGGSIVTSFTYNPAVETWVINAGGDNLGQVITEYGVQFLKQKFVHTSSSFSGALALPKGTTSERPWDASHGWVRYNMDLSSVEVKRDGQFTSDPQWEPLGFKSQLGYRNLLINASRFNIWQRGDNFPSPASYTYTADRWLTDGLVQSVSRDFSKPSHNYLNVSTNPNTGIAQRVETLGAGFKQGQSYCLSGQVRLNVVDIRVVVTYRQGNVFAHTLADSTLVIGTHIDSFADNEGFRYFKYTFDLDASPDDFLGVDCLQISFWSGQSNVMTFKSVQFEEGSTPSPFERRPIGLELELCQRYFEKSYNLDEVPGTVTSSAASTGTNAHTSNVPTRIFTYGTEFRTRKRTNPTITYYTQQGLAGYVAGYSSGTAYQVVGGGTGSETRLPSFITTSPSANTNEPVAYQWTADAEL